MSDPQEPRAFQDGLQFAWDSTSITLAETCLRKYYYRMVEGWQPHRKSVHLIFGGLYADALEKFYKHRANGADIEEALRRIVRQAMIDSWDFEKGTQVEFDHPAKTRANLIRSIVWYIDEFGDETDADLKTWHRSNGEPAVELSFTIQVDDDLMFAGHLDRVVDYSGELYVMDQKTTGGTITPRFFDGFKPDIQMSMYTFAGESILHTPVKGVMIDGAQIAVNFTRFMRGFTFRTEDELAEWYDCTMQTIERARTATREQHFPMNRTACGNYGGCEFRHVCGRSPQVRDSFLRADFKKGERWDPLSRR